MLTGAHLQSDAIPDSRPQATSEQLDVSSAAFAWVVSTMREQGADAEATEATAGGAAPKGRALRSKQVLELVLAAAQIVLQSGATVEAAGALLGRAFDSAQPPSVQAVFPVNAHAAMLPADRSLLVLAHAHLLALGALPAALFDGTAKLSPGPMLEWNPPLIPWAVSCRARARGDGKGKSHADPARESAKVANVKERVRIDGVGSAQSNYNDTALPFQGRLAAVLAVFRRALCDPAHAEVTAAPLLENLAALIAHQADDPAAPAVRQLRYIIMTHHFVHFVLSQLHITPRTPCDCFTSYHPTHAM